MADGIDHLAVAVAWLGDATRSTRTHEQLHWTGFAGAHALVSIAESLRELATRPYAVPGAVETVELDDRTHDDPIPCRLADAEIEDLARVLALSARQGVHGQARAAIDWFMSLDVAVVGVVTTEGGDGQ